MSSSDLPLISVILPVFNGARFLARAVASVLRQTFPSWELLLVDDGSTDPSYDIMQELAREDSRLHPLRLPVNRGVGAARNEALRRARGEWIAYLDHDDEYYPEYVQLISHYHGQADVLFFAYDLLEERPEHPNFGQISTWIPQQVSHLLMVQNIAVPLGVAHRRQLLEKVGLFNEQLRVDEDTDLWQRFARAGASLLFLTEPIGLYHIRADSGSRTCGLQPQAVARSHPPRLLFCSFHCYVDPSSGAALATRDVLELLAGRGWKGQVLCGPLLDFEETLPLEQHLRKLNLSYQVRTAQAYSQPVSVYHFIQGHIPVALYHTGGVASNQPPTRAEGYPFLALLEKLLDTTPPDVLLTYGGDWVAQEIIACARRRGIPVVFALHNFAYQDGRIFRDVQAILVPSEFARASYARTLGLNGTVISGPLGWSRIQCPKIEGRYVTFVNPQPHKGVFVFARLARDLWQQRPDIPLLVIEGRAKVDWLGRTGLDLRGVGNIHVMANTPDPRDFYKVSRLVLVPSLWNESFGRVAAEVLALGLPVLASRRGSLPEVLQEAGFLFDIPSRYTPESRLVPTSEEVRPWLETLVRLWDDPSFYETARQRCLAVAAQWRPEILAPRYEEFFRGILFRKN